MKTTDYAINRVFSIIKASAITLPVYKLIKPTDLVHSEYIVINALPINEGVLQKCRVNVNYHVKDLKNGMPDLAKLETLTATLMGLLQDVTSNRDIINFESQEYFREDQLGEHYSNIRLSLKVVND